MLKPFKKQQLAEEYSQMTLGSLKERAMRSLNIIKQLLSSLTQQQIQKQSIPQLPLSFDPQFDLQFTRLVNSKQVHAGDYNNWRTSVDIKHNWIGMHLDDQTKTTKVIGRYKNQWVSIRQFDQITHTFGITNYSDKQSQYSNSISKIKSIALNQSNKQLYLQFQQHQNLYEIYSQVSRIQISQKSKILFNLNQQGLKRVVIFAIDQNEQQPYKYFDGRSSTQAFIWPVLLNPGKYVIYTPKDGTQASKNYQIITCEPQLILIPKQNEISQIKLYNLFVSAFKEKKQIEDRRDVQMIRANYLDAGIVVQIIKNRYFEPIRLQNLKRQEENKQLLFSRLYRTGLSCSDYDQLEARQLVIRFYKLTAIPARLYIPQRKQNILLFQDPIGTLINRVSFVPYSH